MFENLSHRASGKEDGEVTGADDVLIKDPLCGAYFSRSSSVQLNFKGQNLYFCSTKCRDDFLAAEQKKDGNR